MNPSTDTAARPPLTREHVLRGQLLQAEAREITASVIHRRAYTDLISAREGVFRAQVALERLAAEAAAEPTLRDRVRDLAQSSKFDGYTTPWMRRRAALLWLIDLDGGADAVCQHDEGGWWYHAAIGRYVLHVDEAGFVWFDRLANAAAATYFIESGGA